MKKSLAPFAFLAFLAACFCFAFCRKEFRFTDDPSLRLRFSSDTLRFDTVFTQLGSATRILKAYNPSEKEWLRISEIELEKGAASKFRLNVDGLAGRSFENLEVAPGDSIYIFAEVTIDPDQPLSASPFILNENLVFETNGQRQNVVLEAWGQNANYFPDRFSEDSIKAFSCVGELVWDDPRPYVIWGAVIISDCELRIPAGARIHFHGGIAATVIDSERIFYNDGLLFIGPGGRLTVEGTVDRPVIIDTDRLEPEFQRVPGQWAGIRIGAGSTGNSIKNAVIRHGIVGVRVDSSADLSIKNTKIHTTSGAGIVGVQARIDAENCLFYENFGASVQLAEGGEYDFRYCTMAAFGGNTEALKMSATRCNDAFCNDFDLFSLSARFKNCIFYGSRADQISIFDKNDLADFDYLFENCIVRTRDLTDASKPGARLDFLDRCVDCRETVPSDSLFVDASMNDFHLDSLSVAQGLAMPLASPTIDLEGKMRDAVKPDLGCFERL